MGLILSVLQKQMLIVSYKRSLNSNRTKSTQTGIHLKMLIYHLFQHHHAQNCHLQIINQSLLHLQVELHYVLRFHKVQHIKVLFLIQPVSNLHPQKKVHLQHLQVLHPHVYLMVPKEQEKHIFILHQVALLNSIHFMLQKAHT